MTENRNIHQMKLHDVIGYANGMMITRVPGGWIYQVPFYEEKLDHGSQVLILYPSFVPYRSEFQE